MAKQQHATSAGAIVISEINGKIKIALAREPEHGDNAWVLPKGHVKSGETLEQTALREIREEVGLYEVQLIKYLGEVERQSVEDSGETVLKTIHFYLAYAIDPAAKPIDDSSTTEMSWFEASEALKVIPFREDAAFVEDQLDPLIKQN